MIKVLQQKFNSKSAERKHKGLLNESALSVCSLQIEVCEVSVLNKLLDWFISLEKDNNILRPETKIITSNDPRQR